MSTKINRVLFDYDGTLIIHDKQNEASRLARMLGIADWQISDLQFRLGIFFEHYFTIKNRKMTYELYLENLRKVIQPRSVFGVTEQQLDEAIRENSIMTTVLANNAKGILEYLVAKGYQVCVFTNGFYDAQVENMKHKGIYEYIEKVYAWDNFYTKPDKRAFLRALAGTAPNENVMIGDSVTADIFPAKQIGIYTVGINTQEQEDISYKPDMRIHDLAELKTLL